MMMNYPRSIPGLPTGSRNHDNVTYSGPLLNLIVLEYGLIIDERIAIEVQLHVMPLHPVCQVQAVTHRVLKQAHRRLSEVVDLVNLAVGPRH